VLHSGDMHTYKLLREGGSVRIFVDGAPIDRTLSANQRNELRDFLGLHGLLPSDIDFKVHELYMTNSTSFMSAQDVIRRSH
jgi:hypothetical protein